MQWQFPAAYGIKPASMQSKLGACLLLAMAVVRGFAAPAAETNRLAAPPHGDGWFAGRLIPRLSLRIAEVDIARLRQHSRQDVPATVSDGTFTLGQVAIHLKGSTGSFRGIDDKPALTLNFSRFIAEQRLRGLSKLHLNNSVEDPSYYNELAGSLLFQAAGVPAPRVTHAMVELNGRPLGLYVLKEGFTREFLGRHFPRTDGNLYDPGAGHDVDEALERDLGDGPADRGELLALAAAAREPNLARRWERLGTTLEVDRFLDFMAMEVLACHRDGYCLARNNFRVYQDPASRRFIFLPHGMDQLFGRADAPFRPAMAGLVARAVIETPDGPRQYRARLGWLVTNVFDVAMLHREADAFVARAKPLLGAREQHELEQAVGIVKERISERKRQLEQQLSQPEPALLKFEHGVALLADWEVGKGGVGGTLNRNPGPDGHPSLHISAEAMTSAAWLTRVLLPKGRYRFEAAVSTKAVKGLSFGNNQGAGLRAAVEDGAPPYDMVGDHAWTMVTRRFSLDAEQEVALFCELRAAGGEAWFDTDSLRLVQESGP